MKGKKDIPIPSRTAFTNVDAARENLKKRSNVLTTEQAKVVNSHFHRIAKVVEEMQQYLESQGMRPLGGWRNPYDYSLVQGLKVTDLLTKDCTECSVVCFDGSCDCHECGNPESLRPDEESTITFGPGLTIESVTDVKDLTISVMRVGSTKGKIA